MRAHFPVLVAGGLLAALLVLPSAVCAGDAAPAPDGLDARVEALPRADADTAYRLALELEAAGRTALAEKAYERVIELSPDHPAARRALGYEKVGDRWLRGDELKRARGFIHYEGRWMTALEFAEATRPAREAADQKKGEDRVLHLLAMIASEKPDRVAAARRQMALEEARFKLAPLAKALRCRPKSLRLYAAEELGRLMNPLAVPALLKRAIDDPEEDVRHAAVAALRTIDEPSTVVPLGRALDSRYADTRARAAEAIGLLGDELGAGYVLHKWEARSGDFPRVYFAKVRQIAYIQDFDVEVAQTSFIADPIVGVLQEGVVEAVKVLATEQTFETLERVAYQNAMRNLTGQDYGSDVKAWARWWKENEARLMDERTLHYERKEAVPR